MADSSGAVELGRPRPGATGKNGTAGKRDPDAPARPGVDDVPEGMGERDATFLAALTTPELQDLWAQTWELTRSNFLLRQDIGRTLGTGLTDASSMQILRGAIQQVLPWDDPETMAVWLRIELAFHQIMSEMLEQSLPLLRQHRLASGTLSPADIEAMSVEAERARRPGLPSGFPLRPPPGS